MLNRAYAWSQSPIIPKFVDSLPGLGPTGANNLGNYLTVMTADTDTYSGSDYYRVVALQGTQKFHTNLPSTPFWGYAQDNGVGVATDQKYLGGVIVASADKPVRMTMRNALPAAHILPVDMTAMGANGSPGGTASGVNRMSIHLHGGFPPWFSDGTPFQDFDPNGGYGLSCAFPPDMPAPAPGNYHLYWTNQQIAKFMWYHDHAMGLTRLNAYAGLATGYVLTDAVESSMVTDGYIPGPASAQTIYLVLQDKTFNADGSQWYPYQYEVIPPPPDPAPPAGRHDWAGPPSTDPRVALNTLANPSMVPEAFMDTTVINGCAYPFLEVQRRHYRFRILNGSQARFYNLQLYFAQSNNLNNVLSKEVNLTSPGPQMIQIGTEGGFLPTPAALPSNPSAPGVTQQQLVSEATDPFTLGNPKYYNLLLAPAERADILIDFSDVPTGSVLILYSDALAPFPEASGDPRNDYYTGDPDYSVTTGNPEGISGGAPSTLSGFGPNTRTMMQFRVLGPQISEPASMDVLKNLALSQSPAPFIPPVVPLPQNGAYVRRLTLNEGMETPENFGTPYFGRLIAMLGTDVTKGNDQWGTPMFYRTYVEGRGEVVPKGRIEIWEIINLTGDTHPMHFHLVNVQVLNRQVLDDVGYLAAGAAAAPGTKVDVTPFLIGAPRPPDSNETGWKETIRMNPHEVTRFIAKFDLPNLPWPIPLSRRLSDPGMMPGTNNPRINGHEYVWHCHILEHEEHDMMHALVVVNPDISGARSLLLD
jgi:spore coat protein A